MKVSIQFKLESVPFWQSGHIMSAIDSWIHSPALATESTGLNTTETVTCPNDLPFLFVLPSISNSISLWSILGSSCD